LLSLFRSLLGTGRSFKFPPDRKYSRYAQAPRTRRILKPQNEIHPAPLLIGFAAFQIGSALRGDGDAVDNFFTAPRHASPLRDRDAGAPATLDGFSVPEQFLGLFA
jgi:hypothetical protein